MQYLVKSHLPVYKASLVAVKASIVSAQGVTNTTLNHTASPQRVTKERERSYNLKEQLLLKEKAMMSTRRLDLLTSMAVVIQLGMAVKREKRVVVVVVSVEAWRMQKTLAPVVKKMW